MKIAGALRAPLDGAAKANTITINITTVAATIVTPATTTPPNANAAAAMLHRSVGACRGRSSSLTSSPSSSASSIPSASLQTPQLAASSSPVRGQFGAHRRSNARLCRGAVRTWSSRRRCDAAHVNGCGHAWPWHSRGRRRTTVVAVLAAFALLCVLFPVYGVAAAADGDDNGVSAAGGTGDGQLDAEPTTTTEFNYAARGSKKMTDKCDSTEECGFPGSVCDSHQKTCQCIEELPVTNHIDKCGKVAAFNESCFFNEQCEEFNVQTECRDGRCICRFEMSPIINKDGQFECKGKSESRVPERYIDPAMIGILAGMALMFIIICVVLRLFSKARWRENRTIFNTPNPRLMNVSLLRESKLLHSQERRGSKLSMRMPSRQPSMASLRPHSPNPSLGSRRGSRGSSNASASSSRSNRSNTSVPLQEQQHQHQHGETQPQQHHQQQQFAKQQHVRAQITNVPVIEVEVVDAKA